MNDHFFYNKQQVLEFLENTFSVVSNGGMTNKILSKKLAMLETLIQQVRQRSFPQFDSDEPNPWGYKIKVSTRALYLSLCKKNEEFDSNSTDSTSTERPYSFQILSIPCRLLTIEQMSAEYGLSSLTLRKQIESCQHPYAFQVGSFTWQLPELSIVPVKELDGWFKTKSTITYEGEDKILEFPPHSSVKCIFAGRFLDTTTGKRSYKKLYNLIVETPTGNKEYKVSASERKKILFKLLLNGSYHSKGVALLEWLYK